MYLLTFINIIIINKSSFQYLTLPVYLSFQSIFLFIYLNDYLFLYSSVFPKFCFSIHLSCWLYFIIRLSNQLSIFLSFRLTDCLFFIHLSNRLYIFLSICHAVYFSVHMSCWLSIFLSIYPAESIFLFIYPDDCLFFIHLSCCLFFYPSILLSLSFYPSIQPTAYFSIHLSYRLSIYIPLSRITYVLLAHHYTGN